MNLPLSPHSSRPSDFWKETWTHKAIDLHDEPLHVVDGYGFIDADAYRRLAQQVIAPAGLAPGDRVLEVGCGAGAFLDAVDASVPGLALHGVDICEAMVALARVRQPRVRFEVGDACCLRWLPDGSFDCAAAFAVLSYLDGIPQASRAIDELLRVVKPGGTVVLGDISDAAHRATSTAFLDRVWAPRTIPAYVYFPTRFFERYARSRGLEVEIRPMTDLEVPSYEPASFRYTVYLRRRR